MKTHGDDELLRDLRDEADLCANEGVPELAGLLNAAADRLEHFFTSTAAPVQDGQDWSLLEATQESLREHMAEIQRLKAQRQWVGLAPHEIGNLWAFAWTGDRVAFARAIEAKLKEKNT